MTMDYLWCNKEMVEREEEKLARSRNNSATTFALHYSACHTYHSTLKQSSLFCSTQPQQCPLIHKTITQNAEEATNLPPPIRAFE